MVDLHKWLNRRQFTPFGELRPRGQPDTVAETITRTLEFADKMRGTGTLCGACFTSSSILINSTQFRLPSSHGISRLQLRARATGADVRHQPRSGNSTGLAVYFSTSHYIVRGARFHA